MLRGRCMVLLMLASCSVALEVCCLSVKDAPSILFDHNLYDFGTVDSGTTVIRHQIRYRDVGSGTLTIVNVRPTCDCVAVVPSKRSVQPDGEEGAEEDESLNALS